MRAFSHVSYEFEQLTWQPVAIYKRKDGRCDVEERYERKVFLRYVTHPTKISTEVKYKCVNKYETYGIRMAFSVSKAILFGANYV